MRLTSRSRARVHGRPHSRRLPLRAAAGLSMLLAACAAVPLSPAAPAASAALPAPAASAAVPAPAAAAALLAGTRWQLLTIESMDDAHPTAQPDDPLRYTLAFGADGRAALRLDCNRATGTWQASAAAASSASGSLSFGPLAATRAMCPPGSLEPRLSKALPYVRSYLLRDGRLHLSLLADGGILSWAPLPGATTP